MGFGKTGGKPKPVKKKGPKGKIARAKAKLDRQWGETAIQDDENETRRKGKSRLLAKKSSVGFGGETTAKTASNAPSTSSLLRNKKPTKEQYSSRNRFDDDDDESLSFSDMNSDSDADADPLNDLLSLIRKSKKKRTKSKRREKVKKIVDDDSDDDDEDVLNEEDPRDDNDDSEMEEDEESVSESGEISSPDNDEDDDDDDDDSVQLEPENGADENNEATLDLFRQRFSREPLKESELKNPTPSTRKVLLEGSLELHVSTFTNGNDLDGLLSPKDDKASKKSPEEWQELDKESFAGNRKVLQRQWKRTHKKSLMTDNQASIYSFLTRYTDLLVTTESRKHRNEMHKMYLLHILNHVLTSRSRIQRHNRQLKEQEKKENENAEPMQDTEDDRFRDQGFTRPTVLVLLPTRGTCHRFVNDLSKIVGTEIEKDHMDRFEAEYGMPVEKVEATLGDDQERRRKAVLEQKGKAWNEIFGDDVHQDDDFKMGIALTPKAAKGKNAKKGKDSNVSVKLYTDFYKSDIIVASPLGLKMLIAPPETEEDGEDDKEGDFDFLSSIEICLLDYADVLSMQNWDHVNDVLSFLNQEPRNNNDTDFSRVRNYLLEGQTAHWRQLIISSNIIDPCLVSSFKRFGKSASGSVKTRRKVKPEDASIASVLVPIKQVIHKVPVSTFDKQSEARVNYFVKMILPQILQQNHTMVYVPSYFDFVSLRNVFLKREIPFVSVTEYSRASEVSRGRTRFLQGRKPIMLFTGRCNFFHRHAIKGVRHLIFLGLPEHPEFYSDQVNLINTTSDATYVGAASSVASCLALFTRYEAHALERIVGSGNCSRMLSSQKATFMFYS